MNGRFTKTGSGQTCQGRKTQKRPGFSSVLTGTAITVQIPGSKWALGGGKSIFVRYHKNVLGLPFITAGDFVFDDAALQVYYNPAEQTKMIAG
jgi:hypothetical protein